MGYRLRFLYSLAHHALKKLSSKSERSTSAIALTLPLAFAGLLIARPLQAQAPPESTVAQQPALSPATNPAISFRRPLRVSHLRIPNSLEFRRSQYFFTFDFPTEAVEPLEKIVFEQVEGADYPRYRVGDFAAFDATDRTPFPLGTIENSRDQRTLTIEFDPPIEPGQPVTVALRARNPRSGIYIYQLSAYPVGATEGQYAGVERLTFDEPVRRDRFFR